MAKLVIQSHGRFRKWAAEEHGDFSDWRLFPEEQTGNAGDAKAPLTAASARHASTI